MDGGHTIVRPNATENCCLMTVHSELEGAERCHLIEVCEGSDEPGPEVLLGETSDHGRASHSLHLSATACIDSISCSPLFCSIVYYQYVVPSAPPMSLAHIRQQQGACLVSRLNSILNAH